MVPFGNGEVGLRRVGARASLAGRSYGRQTALAISVLALLSLVGRGVAVTLGSPLLAVVAVGMTFLIGVATFGAVDSSRR